MLLKSRYSYKFGHNFIGGDMSFHLFWPYDRCSTLPSPRMTSPGPSSRIHSGAVTPPYPRTGGPVTEFPMALDDGKQQSQ